MQDSEKQKFEENWKKAFDGAEMTPPDRVWNSIEVDLAGQESAVMKKRVVFYQRLAAAMLLFALGAGAYGYYSGRSQETGVRNQETTKNEVMKGRGDEGTRGRGGEVKKEGETPATERILIAKEKVKQKVREGEEQEPVLLALAETQSVAATRKEEEQQQAAEPQAVVEGEKKEGEKEKKEETIAVVSPLLQEVEEPQEIVKPKKRSRENNLWLALGASAGNYSQNTPSATSVPQPTLDARPSAVSNFLIAAAPPKRTEPKVGQSYSFGLSVGKKFGRIVVQTGVSLGRQQVEYTSNYNAVTATSNTAKAASVDYLDTQGQEFALAFTPTDYTVHSTMEIISIPVQAGYMIIDRQIGWQVNAGVSPDFFLKNVVEDESGQRESLTQSAGSSSPYRSVNWSGLLNTELSYRLGRHYRLSLVPGVRYSFKSILKEPADNGRPVILDVGFRFRYLFE